MRGYFVLATNTIYRNFTCDPCPYWVLAKWFDLLNERHLLWKYHGMETPQLKHHLIVYISSALIILFSWLIHLKQKALGNAIKQQTLQTKFDRITAPNRLHTQSAGNYKSGLIVHQNNNRSNHLAMRKKITK